MKLLKFNFMKLLFYPIIFFAFLILNQLSAQKLSLDIYSGANVTSISNSLLGARDNSIRKPGIGFQLGMRAGYIVTSKMKVITGICISNRSFREDFFPNGVFDNESMYLLEIPMMLRIPINQKIYTTFGLLHSYKFALNTHYIWNNQKEILYGIDAQIIGGYRINRKFGIEAGVLYGSLLDHALSRLNFTNFVGSLCLTYKLK